MAGCGSSLSGWKLKEFKVSHFSAQRFSKAQKNFSCYLFFPLPRCLNTDRASDDAGRMERWGEQIKYKWHPECYLYTSLQSHRHGGVQIPLPCIPLNQKKNLAFFYLITPLNIPYHTCLTPWGSQGQMWYQIFKLGDSWRDLSWQISQAILFRYSPSVLRGVWG